VGETLKIKVDTTENTLGNYYFPGG